MAPDPKKRKVDDADTGTGTAVLEEFENGIYDVFPIALHKTIKAAILRADGDDNSIANQSFVWQVTVYRRGAPVSENTHVMYAVGHCIYDFEETFLYADLNKANMHALVKFKEWTEYWIVDVDVDEESKDGEEYLLHNDEFRQPVEPKFLACDPRINWPVGEIKAYGQIAWMFGKDGALAMATKQKAVIRDGYAEDQGDLPVVPVDLVECMGVRVQRKEVLGYAGLRECMEV
jgi:hypothetical protein